MSNARKRANDKLDTPAEPTPRREIRCGACSETLVEINLLIDGEELTMRSCSRCDHRSWHRGDAQVELGGILADLSSSPTRYRRDLAAR